MGIKIIATDLDGTLMAPDHITVTSRTKTALKNAQEMGIKIAIATGRTLSFIEDARNQLPFIDYIIFSNGASVYDCKQNKVIYKNHIDPSMSDSITTFLDGFDLFYNVYIDGKIYTKKGNYNFLDRTDMPTDFLRYFISMNIQCDDLKKVIKGKSAELIIAYYINEKDRPAINNFVHSSGKLCYVSSVMNNMEIMNATAGKGSALSGLCNILGCTAKEAMCFGDSDNDRSMLEFADYSFAMENGDACAKSAAKFLTCSNAENGVAAAIEKYILA